MVLMDVRSILKADPNSNTPVIGFVTTDTEKTVHVSTKRWRKHFFQLYLKSRENIIIMFPLNR